MPIDCPSEASPAVESHAHSRADQSQSQVTIDILSDDDLLYVFDFYVAQAWKVEAWHTLVHVCRRWRFLVFGSPRRLNLRIECRCKTPFSEKIDIWPALPIVILGDCDSIACRNKNHHIGAILKHRDRVCRIKFHSSGGEVGEIFAEPLPVLTDLEVHSDGYRDWDPSHPIFPDPDRFLGASTHLRSLSLTRINISELLPKLLLSSTDLVDLRLRKIPTSGFISPEKMVTALSAMTRLQVLHLEFGHPEWETRRVPTRTAVLPSLIELRLVVEEFIEHLDLMDDLMAWIDAPRLNRFYMVVSFDHDGLNTPQILRFIAHVPKFQAFDEAHMEIDVHNLSIEFLSTSGVLKLQITCAEPELLLPQFCRSPFFPLLTLGSLYIDKCWALMFSPRGDARWLDLLRPFTSVKNLYLCDYYAVQITSTLLAGLRSVTDALPALESLFLEEVRPSSNFRPLQDAFGKYAARQAPSGHPIAVSQWDRSQKFGGGRGE